MSKYTYSQYLFLDGDTLILNDPTTFLPKLNDVSLCPVNSKGVGIHDLEDKGSSYWLHLFEKAGVDLENIPKVATVASREKIIAYWNSGVILFDGQSAVCHDWKMLLYEMLSEQIFPNGQIFFTEQTCLTAILLSGNYTVGNLPVNSNFPVLKNRFRSLEEIKSASIIHHYNNLALLENKARGLVEEGKINWIRKKILEFDVYPSAFYSQIVKTGNQLRMTLMEKLYFFIYKISRS